MVLMLWFVIFISVASTRVSLANVATQNVQTMMFLISVNATWWGPGGCLATVVTPALIPDRKFNQSTPIAVGRCDSGPLTYTVSKSLGKPFTYEVDLTFYSSDIVDASPPTCQIPWNGTYLVPTSHDPKESLLPGCFVMDSREGYHMTYYWFHILKWTMV